ncbi:ATP-binding protein [Lysobacteraceae bacterium NML95-0200]|nr:ATP-binding protein [Xanthomonadaceae bacterium NML95-0200]
MKAMESFSKKSVQTLQQAAVVLQAGYGFVNRSYLSSLGELTVQSASQVGREFSLGSDVRIFHMQRLVSENRQSVLESSLAAYTALGASGYAVFLLLSCDGQETQIYLGARGEPGKVQGRNAGDLLKEAFRGQFPGSSLQAVKDPADKKLADNIKGWESVAAVTGVPSLSTEEREHFVQGLERFIDAAEGQKYQALILADPVSSVDLDIIRQGYESLSTQLSPLLKQQLSYGIQESESVAVGISRSISESLGNSISMTETRGTTNTEGTSQSHSSQTPGAKKGVTLSLALGAGLGALCGGPAGATVGAGIGGAVGSALFSKSSTEGKSQSSSESFSTAEGTTQSSTRTEGSTDSHTTTGTLGTTEQVSIEGVNKGIEQLLARIDRNLQRVEEAKAYGGWNTAAYFMADDQATSRSLASIFLGLMRGGNSSNEDFAITSWRRGKKEGVLEWLSMFAHPHLNQEINTDVPVAYLTPATLVSGKEMAIQMSLPRRSTSTVSVIETQAFGRRVQYLDEQDDKGKRMITLGNVRHLWETLPQPICLDLDQLTSHVFVTGSTGAGKSNTIYEIVSQVSAAGVPFLIVEPAKGEYKHVFGHRKDVRVLGTNPAMSELLRINPFAFPKGIHVLEHIDRLVEIFNVCWPMYAAMPAVLKEATLHAYEQCGWDLNTSINVADTGLFPTFSDLLDALNEVIASSEYSDEIKGNYVGALATRVRSLANGLNGQIFCADEISDEELFDSNVIIDLSRVGSQESKALIMGVLIMRLSEYRMTSSGMNQPLRHLTVLEEAHNILRRTSTEQSTEGANVAGKAVEMLTNAIAEMRTYGEGFLIADQSPNAIDIAAIRNTNTKIVMRLPDDADRQLAGKSAAMTDEQLQELARLPRGVAVVYKNNWLEPVLCQVKRFEGGEKEWVYEASVGHGCEASFDRKRFNLNLSRLFLNGYLRKKEAVDMGLLRSGVNISGISSKLRLFSYAHINERADLLVNDYQLTARHLVDALGLKEKVYRCISDGLKGKKPTVEPVLCGMIAEMQKEIKAVVSNECSKDLLFAITDCCFMSNQKEGEQLGVQLYREWQETARETLV